MPTFCRRPAGLLALALLPCLLALLPAGAAEPRRPRLAVLVYFDQFRGDYLSRWEDLYGPDGFRRLTKDGAWFQNCHYPYANTVTAAGHTSVATGCSPETHGIIANDWYDRDAKADVYCVGSDRYERVPPRPAKAAAEEKDDKGDKEETAIRKKKYKGVSPERVLAPTLGDALKEATGGKGRVVALSFKDRAAAAPAGQHPDACYWFDPDGGVFATSTYYRDRPHSWVADFNAGRAADRWFDKEWTRLRPDLDYARYSGRDDQPGESKGVAQGVTFPHPFDGGPKKLKNLYYEQVYTSPAGNELLLELAKKAVEAEELGKHDTPDFLSLSFSCNDPVGHAWGPDSQEVLDVTLRSDLIVKELLAFLDAKVGKGNYTLALTADHGVCPLPEVSQSAGRAARRVLPPLLKAKANDFLTKTFGGDEKTRWVEEAIAPWVYLSREVMKQHDVKQEDVEAALADWLKKQTGIERAYTRTQLLKGVEAEDAVGQKVRRSFQAERCGDLYVLVKPYFLVYGLTGTSHGTPYEYDTHVPLVVFGAGVKPGVRKEEVTPQAAASILARALGIKPPAKADAPVPAGLFE